MSRRITVIGAGVIVLSIAHEFATAGDQVTIVTDQATEDTVSAVAAALWFPFHSEHSPLTDRLLERSLHRFLELQTVDGAGVVPRTGTIVERREHPDRSWTTHLTTFNEATPDQLPPGARSGVRATLPFIETPRYLAWLVQRVQRLGVTITHARVSAIDELAASADLVIVAGGIRGGELLGTDPEIVPVKGQIVLLENQHLDEWIVDEDHPDGLTYIFSRENDIVVGGIADVGNWVADIDPDVEAAILTRARTLMPQISGLAQLGSRAGLRPGRPTIRLENIDGFQLPVIAAYGHGGAGVTLSWGTAEYVLELAAGLGERDPLTK